MTIHRTGTREEWLAARLDLLEAEKELTRRATSWRGSGRNCPGCGSTRNTASKPMRGAPRWPTSSRGARSCSSITSCSGPTTPRAARPARRSRTGSTASIVIWRTTTSRSWPCRGRRSRSCRHTSSAWAGRFPGRPRPAATSTHDFNVSFTEEQQRDRGRSTTTTGAAGHRDGCDRRRRGPVAEFAADVGTDVPTYTRDRPGMSAFVLEDGVVYHTLFHLFARSGRAVGHVSSGSTARPRDVTKRASGGAATTSTAQAE
jgi:hypothetical protein